MKTKPKKNKGSPVNTEEKQAIQRDERGRWVKGVSGNPHGRPPGAQNFITDFTEAIRILARKKNRKMTTEDAMRILHERGFTEAALGKFPFWKEIFDRYYGKPTGDDGTKIQINISQKIDETRQRFQDD